MRFLTSILVAAGLLTGHAATAQTCASGSDHLAFDVAGLKSQLMVTALTCNEQDKYNAFIMKYRPDLVEQDKNLNSYFSRAHGRRARTQFDDYITQLANSQSQYGLRRGTLFCDENKGIFDEVMALKGGSELPDFAAGKALAQPMALTTCAAEPAKPAQASTRRAAAPARKKA